MGKMRVLQLAKFTPTSAGGLEYVVRTICDSLCELAVSNSVVCFRSDAVSEGKEYSTFECRELFSIGSQPLSIKYLLLSLSQAAKSTVVIAHSPNALSLIALILIKVLQGKTCYIFWHADVVPKNIIQKAFWLLMYPLENIACSLSDGVIFTTKTYASNSYTQNFQIKEKLFWPIVTKINVQKKSQLSNKKFLKLLFVGRLVPYKGLADFLRNLTKVETDYHLDIVGSGPELSECTRIVDENHLDVVFHGELASSELTTLYASCDILVLPSKTKAEAFGVVLLEAMSFAKPVVTSIIPGSGINEVNREFETGLTFNVNDYRSLELALRSLMTGDTYGRLSEGCLKHLNSNYSTLSQTERIKKFLNL